jgi:Tol biopolymer transport system component
VILFELLTGRRPFDGGDTVTDTLAAIMMKEPDLAELPKDTPHRLRGLIERCLRKDSKTRLRDIGEARVLLDEPEIETPAPTPAPAKRGWLPWAATAGALILGALGGIFWMRSRPAEPDSGTVRFSIPFPSGTTMPVTSAATEWVPSPDGRNLAMVFREKDGKTYLWVRPLNSAAAHHLDKTEGASFPFWSPDGQSIGFFTLDAIKRVSISGGGVTTICGVARTTESLPGIDGAAWSTDGFVVFGSIGQGLRRVPAAGGIPTPITTVDQEERGHSWPQLLPDGRHVLYLARNRNPNKSAIWVQEIGSTKRIHVMDSLTRAVWSPLGYLLFIREGTLFAQRMNSKTFQLEGEPLSVAEEVLANESNGRSTFAISQNGVLVYRFGSRAQERQLAWRDRSGRVIGLVGKPAAFNGGIRLSPDEKTAAVIVGGLTNGNLWVMDLASGVTTPMTRDGSANSGPVWAPDSKRLVIRAQGAGIEEFTVASGQARVVTKDDQLIPTDWSRDGNFILCRDPGGNRVSLVSVSDGSARTVITTPFRQTFFVYSADGKYVAYQSSEPGTTEVYVASFPSFSVKKRVSEETGINPAWRRGGGEIFYRSTSGAAVFAVEIGKGSELTIGKPKELFRAGSGEFAVSADGKRFLIRELPQETKDETLELSVVINWDAEIKK